MRSRPALAITGAAASTAQPRPPALAPISTAIPLGDGDRRPPARTGPALGWGAVGIAAVLAVSPLASGYFDFSLWGPVTLGSMVLLVILARTSRAGFTRAGLVAGAAIGGLLALSAASLLWAESKDAAWTATNRLAFYAALFGIVLLAVRERRSARLIVLILGSAALLTSVWLCASMLLGTGQGAFLTRRLNAPIGYINGTAGLLVMGLWPWLACAETAERRMARAAGLAAAAMIASTFVLTQSRALIPAAIISAVLVLLCTGNRLGRALNLILLSASVAAALPWTLAVYSGGGVAARSLPPGHGPLRAAALAILTTATVAGVLHWLFCGFADRLAAKAGERLRRRLGAVLALAAVLGLAIGGALAAPWLARQYHSFTALKVNPGASVRFIDAGGFRYDLWRVAARELRAHPLSGLGAGNYDVEYYRRRHNPEYVVQPHSLELQMAAELGVGGIGALLLFCGAIVSASGARRGTLASEDRLVKIAATGMFAAWLLDTSVDWIYDIPGLTGMAMVAAALLVVPAFSRPASRPRRRAGGRPIALILGLVVIALLAASVGRQYAATRYAQAGANELIRSPQTAIGSLRQAQRLDPYSLSTLYSLAAAFAKRDDYRRSQAALLLAAAREPHNYVPPALVGDLALRRGAYRLAAREYRRALALNPRDPALLAAERGALSGTP